MLTRALRMDLSHDRGALFGAVRGAHPDHEELGASPHARIFVVSVGNDASAGFDFFALGERMRA